MDTGELLRRCRQRSGLSLRALARRAATSHSAVSAYEANRVAPTVDTLDRIVRAAGFTLNLTLVQSVAPDADRARELEEVLELAAQFPARHSRDPQHPRFGRR